MPFKKLCKKTYGTPPPYVPTTYVLIRERGFRGTCKKWKWVLNLTVGTVYEEPEKVKKVIEDALKNAFGETPL